MPWLRSPLLHFLAIGLLLMGLDAARVSLRAQAEGPPPRIEIDAQRVAGLEQDFARQMGRRPEPSELERLIETEVEEEILYREAIGRGLLERDGGVQTRMIQKMLFLEGRKELEDAGALLERARELRLYEDDIVVRRILIQKMRLYGSALHESEQPDADEIAARYAATRESLRAPDRMTFVHVFLSADDRRDTLAEDAEGLRSRLVREAVEGAEGVALGDPFPLGHRLANRSARDLTRSFGAGFGAQAFEVPDRSWSEPIESAYGRHLLWVESRTSGDPPSLEAASDRIRRELEAERREAKLRALLGKLRNRYEVVVLDAQEELG